MTQPYEIRAWLGVGQGVAWTEEQVEQITSEYLRLEPGVDGREERQALLTAVAQHVDGTLDRVQLVEADAAAQTRAAETRRALRAALRVEVAAGMSEYEAARLYGVDRMTVRAWLGKR